MSLKRVHLSNRSRIVLAVTIPTSLLLAFFLWAVISITRINAISRETTATTNAASSLWSSRETGFDLAEFRETFPGLSVAVYDPSGALIEQAGTPIPPFIDGLKQDPERVFVGALAKGRQVVVSASLARVNDSYSSLWIDVFMLWLFSTLCTFIATFVSTTQAFRPLQRLSSQALKMSGTNLSERLDPADSAEFGEFAANLNTLLERIEETVNRADQFSADAAHELRTPLAILRMRLETSLIKTRTTAEYEEAMRSSILEIGRLTSITESLLRSSRGEFYPADRVDLQPFVLDAITRWTDRLAVDNVNLEEQSEPSQAYLTSAEFNIVIDNLLENARRFAPSGSTIRVLLWVSMGKVELRVEDEGPGVPVALRLSIFDRFARADDSRNRSSGGVGIGLAVCRQIIEGRKGTMKLERLEGPTRIGFSLPAA
ncbi:hypothetical protein BH11ARM1_BH11ARM1_09820 [soil metagenome]